MPEISWQTVAATLAGAHGSCQWWRLHEDDDVDNFCANSCNRWSDSGAIVAILCWKGGLASAFASVLISWVVIVLRRWLLVVNRERKEHLSCDCNTATATA